MTTTAEPGYVKYQDIFDAMRVTVPEGESGNVAVRRFEVSDRDAEFAKLRAMIKGGRGGIDAGEYTKLVRNGALWMSDTPDERRDHIGFVQTCQWQNYKSVLVSGLGLGMVLAGLAQLDGLERATVVDIDPDVIALVGPHYEQMFAERGKELEVVCGDALTPTQTFGAHARWDAAWHDIWPEICGDDYEQHKQMRRRYSRKVTYQRCWMDDEVKMLARGDRW